jgi:hypothetical protein
VIINNFDFMGVSAAPLKTDAPLTIDPDAVPAFPVAFK